MIGGSWYVSMQCNLKIFEGGPKATGTSLMQFKKKFKLWKIKSMDQGRQRTQGVERFQGQGYETSFRETSGNNEVQGT